MNSAHAAIDIALGETYRLRRLLKRSSTAQVRSADECAIVKATALAWFNSHRHHVAAYVDTTILLRADNSYRKILEGSDRATARTTYDTSLRKLCASNRNDAIDVDHVRWLR